MENRRVLVEAPLFICIGFAVTEGTGLLAHHAQVRRRS